MGPSTPSSVYVRYVEKFCHAFRIGFLNFLKHGYAGPITVVSKEPHSPIDRLATHVFAHSPVHLMAIAGRN